MQPISKASRKNLPQALILFAKLICLLTIFAWIVAAIFHMLGYPRPYSWPYFGEVRGSDLTGFWERFKYLHTPTFFQIQDPPLQYPATLAIFYHIFFSIAKVQGYVYPVFIAFALATALVAASFFYRALLRRGIAKANAFLFCLLMLVFSYPLYYDIQRGNIEVIVWITLMLAIFAFRKQRWMASAIFIGIAIAFKYYPVILLGLFLDRKRYKAIPVALLTAVTATVLANLWMGPTISIAFHETRLGTQSFVEMYARHFIGVGYDHSFFSLIKFLVLRFHPYLVRYMNLYLNLYLLTAAITATALYFIRIRRLPVINQIAILMILSITLPPVSFDYTLLHVYTCFAVFALYLIDERNAGRAVPMDNWIMVWFALALLPYQYVILSGEAYGAQVRICALIALLYIFLKQPFPETDQELNSGYEAKAHSIKELPA